MASANVPPQFAADVEYMKTFCDRIMPKNEFTIKEGAISMSTFFLQRELEGLTILVELAQDSILRTTSVPVEEEVSPYNSANSASSANSTSTQRYTTSWNESPLFDALSQFTEAYGKLAVLLDLRDELQQRYDKNMAWNDQFETKKAEWYKRMSEKWDTLTQTPAYTRFREAENQKNDRITRVERLGQTLGETLVASANDLLAAKHALLKMVSMIPVSPNELSEAMMAAIRTVRMTTVPLVNDDLRQPAPGWIDRIGYEMRHIFGMDVD